MDRLTFEGNFCDIAKCSEAVCPCGGLCTQKKVWERLKYYEDAEQDGQTVVLPCKVGDTVYGIKPVKEVDGHLSYEMKHGNVLAFKILENCVLCMVPAKEQFDYPVGFRIEDFGKTVFLTREEAEAVLKGGDLPEDRTDRR